MIDLNELRQLIAFADSGTLSHVADEFHISTPSVTRSMQHLEEAFSVSLFVRGKNRIELNETGKTAVAAARKLLKDAEQMIQQVQEFDARQRTIVIRSCAPAPLWNIQKNLNTRHPNMMISSAICQTQEVVTDWENRVCDIAILPYPIDGAKLFMKENLFVCVPKDHELAVHPSLSFRDINGFNFLLRTELGFWDTLCRKKMPASKFLVQPDADVFEELVQASSLPCFTTDYGDLRTYENRIAIPLTDEEAHVTFYMLED